VIGKPDSQPGIGARPLLRVSPPTPSTGHRLIAALNAEIDALGEVVAEHFGRHRDAEIYLSQPGLGPVLSARVLAEFGDDPDRFADAKSRKNYAGTSPITRASGTRRIVLARYARNRRLADALHQWAFCSLKGSPGARAYYQALRSRGIGHQAALRQLSNRLVANLHARPVGGRGRRPVPRQRRPFVPVMAGRGGVVRWIAH
jgi:transposase